MVSLMSQSVQKNVNLRSSDAARVAAFSGKDDATGGGYRG